jgi:hypothetical protein
MCQVIMVGCDLHDPMIVNRNPKKKKIVVVASMGRLAVRMWHRGREFPPGHPSRSMILAEAKWNWKRSVQPS